MAQMRATFPTASPETVRQALVDELLGRGYDVSYPSTWSIQATRGSVGRNILLGGFGQRMDLRFDLYVDPVSGVIVDAGVSEQVSALVMGGAVGAMKTSNEISAVIAAVHARLDPPGTTNN